MRDDAHKGYAERPAARQAQESVRSRRSVGEGPAGGSPGPDAFNPDANPQMSDAGATAADSQVPHDGAAAARPNRPAAKKSQSRPSKRAEAAIAVLIGLFASVFLALAFYGFVLAAGYAVEIGCWASFVLLAIAAAAFVAASRSKLVDVAGTSWFRVFVVAQIVSIPLMLVVAWTFLGNTGQDYHQLFSIATAHVRGEDIPYFAKYGNYPNNHLLLMFMINLFELVDAIAPGADDATFMWVHVVVNVAFVQASFLLVAYAAKCIWGPRRGAVAGLLMLACSPIWLNVSNPYSDTGSLLFVSLAIWCAARFFAVEPPAGEDLSVREALRTAGASGSMHDDQATRLAAPSMSSRLGAAAKTVFARRLALAMIFAVVCVIGFKVKATVAVLAVAFALAVLLCMRFASALKVIAALAVAAAVTLVGTNAFVDQMRPDDLPYDAAVQDRYTFPYEHWFMMMLNPDGGGVYVLADYKYTNSFKSLDAKKQAVHEEIARRVGKLGPEGVLARVAFEKPAALWKNGALVRDDELAEWRAAEGGAGVAFSAYMNYAQGYHLAMLGSVALSGLWMLRNRKRFAWRLALMRRGVEGKDARRAAMVLMLMMALFGFTTFICLAWEAKVRYVVHFMPLLVLLEAEGLAALKRFAFRLKK